MNAQERDIPEPQTEFEPNSNEKQLQELLNKSIADRIANVLNMKQKSLGLDYDPMLSNLDNYIQMLSSYGVTGITRANQRRLKTIFTEYRDSLPTKEDWQKSRQQAKQYKDTVLENADFWKSADDPSATFFAAHSERATRQWRFGSSLVDSELQYPIYGMGIFNPFKPIEVTTRHGTLPSQFIVDSDNNLYYVNNAYLFDTNGKASKYEEIIKHSRPNETLEDTLKGKHLDPNVIKSVSLALSKEDSRHAQLEIRDYRVVLSTLAGVEIGAFTQR